MQDIMDDSNMVSSPSEDFILSLVVPAYNEAENIPALHSRVTGVLAKLSIDYEVILVDNSSIDDTGKLARELIARDARWKYVRLSRNFGYQINVSAGISYATGDAIVVMDADLQDPPELIIDFVQWWQRGYDVVYGVRHDREGEPFWRRIAIRLYYRMLSRLSPIDLPLDAGDFRLISRKVQREFLRFHESTPYVRGIFAYIGFRHKGLAYVRQPRRAGRSKFPLAKLISLGLDGIVSFSMVPLRVMLVTGCVVLGAAFVYGVFAIRSFMQGASPPGWTTMIILMLAMSGVQIVFLGLIGEYIGRTYMDAKRRPLWIVAEEFNTERRDKNSSRNARKVPNNNR